jgi:prepilin-type N-terminal cleavage/methylation domain-containing protein
MARTDDVIKPPPVARRRTPRARAGFTLLEVGMVLVIIGIGVLSMLQLVAAGTVSNTDAAGITTAMTLASNMREASLGLAYYDPNYPAPDPDVPATCVWDRREASYADYDNITDLDGPTDTWDKPDDAAGFQKFSPPINGTRKPISGYDKWAQYVKVETVDPKMMRRVLPHDPTCEAVRVTVKVTRDNALIYQTSWVIFSPLARESVDTVP